VIWGRHQRYRGRAPASAKVRALCEGRGLLSAGCAAKTARTISSMPIRDSRDLQPMTPPPKLRPWSKVTPRNFA